MEQGTQQPWHGWDDQVGVADLHLPHWHERDFAFSEIDPALIRTTCERA